MHPHIPYKHYILFFTLSLLSSLSFSDKSKAQHPVPASNIPEDSINLVLYEYKDKDHYETIAYMPYYPAYALISFRSQHCNAELTGFINPFSLQKNQLEIHYKKCKISFDQQKEQIINPKETEDCQDFHPQACNFTSIPHLKKVKLHFSQSENTAPPNQK